MIDVLEKTKPEASEELRRSCLESFGTARKAVTDTLEDGKRATEHLLRRCRDTGEELVEEASHEIKRHPLTFVAAAFATGAVVGFLLPRNGKNPAS